MPEELGEKTEDATPKRLQDAREEGNVAKSTDVAGALLLLGVTAMLWAALMPTLGGLKTFIERTLSPTMATDLISPDAVQSIISDAFDTAVRVGAPLLLVAWLIAFVSYFWQIGWLFAPKAIEPKLSKLNPISGFQRIMGLAALVKAGLDSSKVGIVILVATLRISSMIDTIVLLPNLDMMQALGQVGRMLLELAIWILVVLIILGFIDLAWQKHKHKRDMRMTKTEVKEEMKQTDGDPETRKRRRQMQQQIAMQRVAHAVPQADVIVTNPEHISVAIQYDEATMTAPRVVAKGADHIALRIRHIAMQHGIPIVERKPLARALFRNVEVGREVPADFYQAVAEILAYVYQLAGRRPGMSGATSA